MEHRFVIDRQTETAHTVLGTLCCMPYNNQSGCMTQVGGVNATESISCTFTV